MPAMRTDPGPVPAPESRFPAFDLPDRFAPILSRIGSQIAIAVVCAAAAIACRVIVDLVLPSAGPFALTFPFVLVATLFARWEAGMLTAILLALYAWYFVLPEPYTFVFLNPEDGPRVAVNVGSGFALVAVAEYYRRFARRLVRERDAVAAERKLYLEEFEHRVKNKFAMVAAMVRMEMREAETEEATAALRTVLGRVESIASAHAALYRGEDGVSEVRMQPYLSALCNSLSGALTDQESIKLRTDVYPLRMQRDRAIAVGLVVNELTTNAVKYAFAGRETGEIVIKLVADDGQAVLSVTDNGVGYSQAAIRPGSHGIGLVTAFAEQAGGMLERVEVPQGTEFRLTLPL